MPRVNSTFRLMTQAIVLFAFMAAVPVRAEGPAPPSDQEISEQISAGRKQLDALTDLDEAAKAKIRDLFDKAQAEMEKAKASSAQAAAFEQRAVQAPQDLERTKAELAAPPGKSEAAVSDSTPLGEIEKKIAQLETDSKRWRRELTDVETELKGRTGRRAEVPKRIAAAQQVLTETAGELQTPAQEGEVDSLTQAARRLMLVARRRAAEAEIQACDREAKAIDARAELLPLLRDLDARRVAQTEQDLKLLQGEINRRRQLEAEQQARKAALEASRASPAVQQLMKENAELAEKRKDLAQSIAEATRQLNEVNNLLKEVTDQDTGVQDKAKSVGLASVIGPVLRKQRAALPDLGSYRRNVGLRQQAMGAGELARLEFQEKRFELSDLDRQVRVALKDLNLPENGETRPELAAAVREALETKREYLNALIDDHEKYYEILDALKTAEQKLIEKTESCSRFIDERVLWVASADPVGPGDVVPAAKALWWLAGPAAWSDVGRALAVDAREYPVLWSIAAATFLMLIYWRRRFRAKIAEIGEKAARGSCFRFLPTVETAALTVLMAVAWPGLAWWIGWRLWSATEVFDVSKVIGAGLTTVARVFLALELLRHTCMAGGLAESHFGWSAPALKVLRHNIHRLSITGLPLMYAAVAMTWQFNDAWDASLGRICCLAALACFSLAVHRVFRPSGAAAQTMIAANRGGWLDRFRYVWYPTIALTPAVLALLAAVGYHYTARQLATRLILTSYVLVGGVVCRALLLRWILVNKRKLAIEQARQRRAAQSESGGAEEAAGGAELPASADPQRDLAAINAQTRHLIEYLLAVAAALALWCAWVDVLPALGILNSVKIWHTQIAVTDLALAALVMATTVTAAKNIPGLLEMVLLQHLPLDAGARYAVATVSRYFITIAGTVLCCGTLGVEWSKVQWLIAAMSLGLGFGLQEIFANFVSGLIILFERPVRVGDVVTIGDVSGVVSRIRSRATTITDWDRKELIIPNKEFITGRVLNWTLSNQVNRVVVEIGVAYGTDMELATKILLAIAERHPLVLKDPPPHAVFDSFGESALNLVMRCYLPNLDNRQAVIHELNLAVDREFRAAGIEIAFPQQDVHIRSLDAPLSFVRSDDAEEGTLRLATDKDRSTGKVA